MTNRFDMDQLLQEAQEYTGLDDYGPSPFKPGLESMIETYNSLGVNDDGAGMINMSISMLLMERLRIEQAKKDYPEIQNEVVNPPMFLTGMPRTGTSALLNLLSQDPATRTMKMWEGLNPSPAEGLPDEADDSRYQMMAAYAESDMAKEMASIHKITADGPEECIHLTNHTFMDPHYGVETFLEPYATFFRQIKDRQFIYEYHHDLLKMLQWQRPANRWLLKTPYHLWSLDCIAKEHPGCSMMITHRNPLEVVGSYSSMMEMLLPQRDKPYDMGELGYRVMEYLADQVNLSIDMRKTLNEDRILDIHFTEFLSDPLKTVETIYEYFNLELTDQLQQTFRSYIEENPRGKHGKHNYKLDYYGLTEQQVHDRFAGYIETYNIQV